MRELVIDGVEEGGGVGEEGIVGEGGIIGGGGVFLLLRMMLLVDLVDWVLIFFFMGFFGLFFYLGLVVY